MRMRMPAPVRAAGQAAVRTLVLALALALAAAFPAAPAFAAQHAPPPGAVVVVRATGPVDPGMAAMVRGAVRAAEAAGARGLVLVVNTPGGLVEPALRIRDALLRTRVPTAAFVEGHATSAGALITLAAEKVYMAPASQIGDAEPIPNTDKNVAFVKEAFAATARARGRNPEVAGAMVDKRVTIPGVTDGLPLTLDWHRAQELGIADGEAADLGAVLEKLGWQGAPVWEYGMTPGQRLGRVLTNPWVATLTLLIAIAALAWELSHPGVGLPGLVAVLALIAFFTGHYLVETAGLLEVGLLVLGITFLAVEVVVPGGIFGVAGLLAVAAGIFLTAPSPRQGAIYLAVAAVGFLGVVLVLARYFSRQGMIRWLTLEQRLTTAGGYVPPRAALTDLAGARGVTLTPLRPAGVARFGDRKEDVVSEGEYVPAGQPVQVIRVDGTRLVVRPVETAAGTAPADPARERKEEG